MALGVAGPTPFAGELSDPGVGVLGGHSRFQQIDPAEPWRGGRWVLEAEDGWHYPLTLSMLLFDSSGVLRDPALDEHRAALRALTEAVDAADADPFVSAGALDWLLYDWLMAHRESPTSGAIEVRKLPDAQMIVSAAAAVATTRSHFEHALLNIPTTIP
ncbi:hypothetical protein BL254_15930 [Protofrankia sp. BMG5.30]|nr:hypothetical protein BL254_15930 [Protofrankia sp. BMG5.30]